MAREDPCTTSRFFLLVSCGDRQHFLMDAPRATVIFVNPSKPHHHHQHAVTHPSSACLCLFPPPRGAGYHTQQYAAVFPRPNPMMLQIDSLALTLSVLLCLRYCPVVISCVCLSPVAQYPLYSASVALYDGTFVGYNLCEERVSEGSACREAFFFCTTGGRVRYRTPFGPIFEARSPHTRCDEEGANIKQYVSGKSSTYRGRPFSHLTILSLLLLLLSTQGFGKSIQGVRYRDMQPMIRYSCTFEVYTVLFLSARR